MIFALNTQIQSKLKLLKANANYENPQIAKWFLSLKV